MASFTQPFTLQATSGGSVGPAATSSFVQADFTNLPGQIVAPELFGSASSGIVNRDINGGQTGTPFFSICNNSTFQSRMMALNLPLLRINFNGAGQSTFSSGLLSNLAANISLMVPSTCTLIITIDTGSGTFNTSAYQSLCNSYVTYWKNNGTVPCKHWEVFNESSDRFIQSQYQQLFQAAVAGCHAADPNSIVCGPTSAGLVDTSNTLGSLVGNFDTSQWGVVDFHQYLNGLSDSLPSAAQLCIAVRPDGSTGNTTGLVSSAQDAIVSTTDYSSLPIFNGEYAPINVPSASDGSQSHYNDNVGGCYLASTLGRFVSGIGSSGHSKSQPFWASLWDTYADTSYSLIEADGSFTVYPPYYVLQRLIATMPGRWATTTFGSSSMYCWSTKTTNGFGVVIVNGGSATSGQVALSHWPVNSTGNGTITKWQMDGTHLTGGTSTVNVTAGLTDSIAIPTRSVTILSQ